MDYQSNLIAPDLRPHFKHLHWRPMGHSFGHDVASDWADQTETGPFAFYKNCGLWTRDEAAILYNVALQDGGEWLDIGAHTGWTSAHIAAAHCSVAAVDPMLRLAGFSERFEQNMEHCWAFLDEYYGLTSNQFFEGHAFGLYSGIVIDGDHEPGKPMEDALNAVKHLRPEGVIVFHDFVGLPVREAVRYLINGFGFRCRIYLTPHVVAVCWREDMIGDPEAFKPPMHVPDPGIVEQNLEARWPENDWSLYL